MSTNPTIPSAPNQQPKRNLRLPVREIIGRVQRFMQENLTLAVVVGILAIAGYLTESYVGSVQEKLKNVAEELTTEKAVHAAEVGDLRQQISEILPASVNFPIPYDPPGGASVVGTSVTLQWSEKAPHQNYLVEVRRLDPQNARIWGDPEVFPATDPDKMRTRFPLSSSGVIRPGTYLWRVVPGSKRGLRQELQGSWSGYYTFVLYDSVISRIRDTNTVIVGVSYVQNSDFMSKDADGNASGFDAEMVHSLLQKLSDDRQLDSDPRRGLQIEFKDYPTIDEILFHGIERGEVDIAIGSITKAKYREQRGIMFTNGYLESRLVLFGNPGSNDAALTADRKVGVVKASANAEAVKYLQKKYTFELILAHSYQELLDSLWHRDIDFMIVDKPLAASLIAENRVAVIKDLTPDLSDYLGEKVGYDREEYAIATKEVKLQQKIDHLMNDPEMRKELVSLKKKYKVNTP